MRYSLINYGTCYSYKNKSYESYVAAMYGIVIMNVIIWIIMTYITSLLITTFRTTSKFLIHILCILLLITIFIDVHSLTNTILIRNLSGGNTYNVNGYVNVSDNHIQIYDQFQLSEMICKLYSDTPTTHVDVYLSTCNVDNNFLYFLGIAMKLVTYLLFIPALMYIWIHETKNDEENTNLML